MDAERARTFLLTLPHVVETMQWGDNLVFWVGDKAVGGKMFTLIDLGGDGVIRNGVVSFASGKERAAEMLEIAGMFPAPYFARIGWVAAERWNVLRPGEWESELRAAHELTFAKLPPKVRRVLALPEGEVAALIEQRRSGPGGKRQFDSHPSGLRTIPATFRKVRLNAEAEVVVQRRARVGVAVIGRPPVELVAQAQFPPHNQPQSQRTHSGGDPSHGLE